MSIRVLIADDHALVREGLRYCLERSNCDIRVVAEAADGVEALQKAEKAGADVYILDVVMPRLNGLDTTRELLRREPDARVVLVSFLSGETIAREAQASGALGYVTKESATSCMVDAVCAARAGRRYVSPDVARARAGQQPRQHTHTDAASRLALLTRREREVLQAIAEGLTTREIAERLQCSPNTVHVHRIRLMAKLGIHKQTALVRFAIREGMARP